MVPLEKPENEVWNICIYFLRGQINVWFTMRGMRSFCSYCDIMTLKFPFYLKSGPAGPQGMPGEAGK